MNLKFFICEQMRQILRSKSHQRPNLQLDIYRIVRQQHTLRTHIGNRCGRYKVAVVIVVGIVQPRKSAFCTL